MGVRQNILTYAGTLFATITTVNGYNTNLGDNVDEWKAYADEESELPSLRYRDMGVEVLEQDNVYTNKKLNLKIECRVSDGSSTSATIRKCIQDVLAAIGTDITWNDNAYDTNYEGDVIEIEQTKNKIGYVSMDIAIGYRTTNWTD